MALSRELSRHFADENGQPLPKRLKLAENAFTSVDLILSRKEDVILNWLCEVSKQSDDIAIWQTLKGCLEFQHNHSYRSVINAAIKAALIQTLTDGLKRVRELDIACVVLQCYQLILVNGEMHRYFMNRPSVIIDLLEQVLSQFYPLVCNNETDKVLELHESIVQSLNLIMECHRRSTNKAELRNNVLNRLVYKLCVFSGKSTNDNMKSVVTKFLQKLIFDKSIGIEKIESDNWVKEIFDALFKQAGDPLNDNDSMLVISHIFHAAVLSYKLSPSRIDRIHRNILNSAPSINLKIRICSDLFRQLHDITFDIENKIDETTLIAYYHGIIDEILSLDHLDVYAYECLDGITNFNPLIVEGMLQNIFKKILLIRKSDNTIKSSYAHFLSDVLDACVRLRRENKLVPWMMTALNDSLTKNPNQRACIDDILSPDFPHKFTTSVNNMTNALAMDVLMCFIHHLNTSSLQSPETNTLPIFLGVISRLTTAFLKGVHVFDHTTPLVMQRKFISGFIKLGKALEKLITIMSPMNKYTENSIHVITMINCWQRIIAIMKIYAPESQTEEEQHTILQIVDNIHQHINKDDSDVDESVIQLLNCCQLEKNRIYDIAPSHDDKILQNITENCMVLLNEYPYAIANFDDLHFSQFAQALLSNINETKATSLRYSSIRSRAVQQNRKLITALIFEMFRVYGLKLKDSPSTTSNLLNGITSKYSLKDQKIEKALKVCKKVLANLQWVQHENSTHICQFLEILLELSLLHLSLEMKTMICLIVFSIMKEYTNSPEVIESCHKILIDITEDCDIDILRYINLNCFIEELSKYPTAMTKVLESSLRNLTDYDSILQFVKSHKDIENCALPTLIECIDKVKLRLKAHDKLTARKAEKKWIKKILSVVSSDTKNPRHVRSLRVAFEAAVASKKLDETMFELIHSILRNIFQVDKDEDHPKLQFNLPQDSALVSEGLKIIKVLLQPGLKSNERVNQILNKDIVKRTWSLILKEASSDIVPHLLDDQRTTLKILKKVLTLLHKQTVNAYDRQDVSLFRNCMTIWNHIARTDTAISHNTRQLYLQQLLEYFSTAVLSEDDSLSVLKLSIFIINSKRVHISEKIIDLILLMANCILTNHEKLSTLTCDEVLGLSLALLTHRSNVITDRLPVVLSLYRGVIHYVIDESRNTNIPCDEHRLQCLALNVYKLAVAFSKLKKDISRVCPYIIADVVEMYSEGVIPAYVKGPLDDSIGIFLSNSDHRAIQLLFRALPSATQEIFKTLYDTYTKFYKFVGKI